MGFAPPDNLVLRLMEAGSDRVTTHSRSGARGLVSSGAAQVNIQGFATCWATGIVLRGVLFVPGVFWRQRLAFEQPNEDRSVALHPVLARSTPVATLMISTRTGTGFLAAFRVVNGLSDARQRRAGRSVTPPRGARGW